LPEFPRASISSFPAREKPFASIEDTNPDSETGSRGQSRFQGGRLQSEDDLTDSTRILRVRPNRPSTEPTNFAEDFPTADFNTGSENTFASTPPPLLTRVRGRPIVPDDFPGPSQVHKPSFFIHSRSWDGRLVGYTLEFYLSYPCLTSVWCN